MTAPKTGRGRVIGLVAAWVVVTLIAGTVAIAAAVDGDVASDDVAAVPDDRAEQADAANGTAAAPVDPSTPAPPTGPSPAPDAGAQDLALEELPEGAMLLFDDPGAGFTTVYPADWIVERDAGTTIFSGRQGTEAYDVTFVVQVVLTAQGGGEYADAQALFQVLRSQIQSAGGEVLGEATDAIELSIGTRATSTFAAIFPQDAQRPLESPVMQMMATTFSRDDATLMAVIYTAPQELYDAYFDVASMMFNNLDVIG